MLTDELTEAQERDRVETPNSALIEGRTEDTLREADKLARDAFIREYIKDFNGKLAMHRIGVTNPKTASTKACIWLREPYVAKKLDEMVRTLRPEDVVSRQQVIAGLWKEANDEKNEGSVRVGAFGHLAKMVGLISPLPDENKTKAMNVMFVPVIGMSDWSAQSMQMQKALRQRASDRGMQPQTIELADGRQTH